MARKRTLALHMGVVLVPSLGVCSRHLGRSLPPSPSDCTDLSVASVASALLGYWTNIVATGMELKARGPSRVPGTSVASFNFDEEPHVPTALGATVWMGHGLGGEMLACGLALFVGLSSRACRRHGRQAPKSLDVTQKCH